MRLLRRARGGDAIAADLRGATITGQVAVGTGNVQLQNSPGAIVNYHEAAAFRPPRLRKPPVRRLPRDFAPLVGRDDVIEAIRDAVAGGIVEVTGEEGIGKTSLLRHFAHRAGGRAPESVVHTTCRGMPCQDILQFLYESLYERNDVEVASPAQLAEYLGEQEALVVLDDLEVAPEDLSLLTTTPARATFVWARPERAQWGEGRAIPLEGLSAESALVLMERELGAELSEGDRAPARELCERLHGRPLKVIQAAALMRERQLSPTQLLEQAQGAPGALRHAVDESLTAQEQAIVQTLAAVPGGAPIGIEAIADVTGDPDAGEVLEGLERRGVVRSNSPRYALAEAAPERKDTPGIRRRLAAHYAARDWVGRRREDVLGELSGVLAVLEAAIEADGWEHARRLAWSVDFAASASGRWGAWERALHQVAHGARAAGDQAAEARALHQLGSRALCLDDRKAAEFWLDWALRLRKEIGDQAGIDATSHNLDVLRRPPPPGGNGAAPSRRPPRGPRFWGSVGLASLAVLGGAVAVLASGGDSDDPGPGATSTNGKPKPIPPIVPGRLAVARRVSFAAQPVDTASAAVSVPARNVGRGTLAVSSASVEGRDRGDFLVRRNGCDGAKLPPRDRCVVQIAFRPSVATGRSAQLVFTLASGDRQVVALGGDGVAPKPIDVPTAAQINPARLDLATYPERKTSGAITVANIGKVPITIGAISLGSATSTDFKVDGGACEGKELAAAAPDGKPSPESSCTVSVVFSPTSASLRAACPPVAGPAQADSTPTFVEPEPQPSLPCTQRGEIVFADTGTGQPATVPVTGTAQPPPPPQLK